MFVNGQNLGRHWSIGPQHFLYLPGAWLRNGENQVNTMCLRFTQVKLPLLSIYDIYVADLGSQNIDYCYVLFQIIVFEEQKADDKILFAESPDHGKTIDVYKLPFCTLL